MYLKRIQLLNNKLIRLQINKPYKNINIDKHIYQ